MGKEKITEGPIPEVYDTEKMIDIHSYEDDPSLDSEKIRYVKSHEPRSKYTHGSNDINPNNITSRP
ncbi:MULTISPECIES: hypothetical protein [unclassified Clostridium]|uniref:hypothetical protein n=1 Tax=unclassified Clostridium TaxID=2614128 RepID=UPI0002975137|nr:MULTISPECIES: hypothetical protein [unclassified Clostridium]EKQ57463.1 MAG: hypothetical protein A370_00836 [Clostridium sp. Maddingley MBC34-26]